MIKRNRVLFISLFFLLLFYMLIGRLIQSQLISTESFSKNRINLLQSSVAQRTQELIIHDGRGRFIDRNNNALTHEYYPTVVLFPFLKKMDWPVEVVADIMNISPTELLAEVERAKEPIVFGKPKTLTKDQMEKINKLKIPGVIAIYRQEKVAKATAEHLIGLIRENKQLFEKRYPEKDKLATNTKIGISGLQSTFDAFLLPEGEAKLLYHVAGDGSPLFGIDVKYTAPANPFYPVAIKTTLDIEVQQMVENVLEKHHLKKGGLVLLDVETNDILSIVSKPAINKLDPFSDGSVENQMLLPQFPGSVFKTVIAAAVIEENINIENRMFNCDLDLYGEGPAIYQHGILNFKDSFAESCNYTFAVLGNELINSNEDVFEEYAKKLGLIGKIGWHGDVFTLSDFRQLPSEFEGRIWKEEQDKAVTKAVAQTSIGQKDVRITPLSIANMMATIARGGEKKQARAVSEVQYKNGTTLFSFPEKPLEGDEIAPYTAMQLQQLLRDVVVSGTSTRLNDLPYPVAGKSGTAETGKLSNNQKLVNKWFAGYFPFEKPKYALVVVDLEQMDGETVTYNVFHDIVTGLYELDKKVQ